MPASVAELPEFYAAVAATGTEVMVQDALGATGVAISRQQIIQLSQIPGVTLRQGRGAADGSESRSRR
ncbi:hypothetical protein E1218_30905 [Kribbella turkmenica]|uniref:Uncharacterized protein n=1 Tax=Kribbella turkmenica TaxID=2530375 RepID=A0A4R4WEV2_9ACTN|nr:hypothetical protein [Kribbella turkmenica]TDD15817.1 hypothetical protein E1218_30905 [Kribbella turkmenica]